MKKILISALLLSVPAIICDDSAADKFVDAIQDIAQSANLADNTIDAIEESDLVEVTTNLRRLDCSDRTQEEKVTILTKLYAVAAQVSDQREKDHLSRWITWSSGKLFRDSQTIEQQILERLDAERMPQGDVKESMDAVNAAIATSDLQLVKDTLRVLDRKNLFGKPLEYALRGFEKAAAQLVEDRTEDLDSPRTESDSFKWKLGAGLLGTGVLGLAYGYLSKMNFKHYYDNDGNHRAYNGLWDKIVGNAYPLARIIGGASATLGSIYPLWKGLRSSEQRGLLAQAKAVHEHIVMRLNKVVAPTSVERQTETPTFAKFEYAIKGADLAQVQSLVWDLECSYLDDDARQDMLDRAASYAAEILTKREEDMASSGSWKTLKIGNLFKRSWKDNAKLAGGTVGTLLAAFNALDRAFNDARALGGYSMSTTALTALVAGYLTRDGWKRTTQKRLLSNAEEIKHLLRKKAN